MSGKESPQNVIDSFRKRQKMMPFMVGGLAAVLVIIGIIILVVWFTGSGHSGFSLFATKTPTPTLTFTPMPATATPTITITPTETVTTLPTQTETPSGPFKYKVQENDTCSAIATKFKVDIIVLAALNNLKPDPCLIRVGDEILIPAPNQQLPTETPVGNSVPRGTKIQYTVKTNDTMASIASKFNTTMESIQLENKLKDINTIYVGQVLTISVNIVTPTVTKAPTSTSAVTSTLAPTTTAKTATPTP
jgi:LysM repeat protein